MQIFFHCQQEKTKAETTTHQSYKKNKLSLAASQPSGQGPQNNFKGIYDAVMGSGIVISSEAFSMSPFLEVVPLKLQNPDIAYIFCKDISKPKPHYFLL